MWIGTGSEFIDLSGVEAFAFDLDGTLVHSEPVWAAAKIAVGKRLGIALDECTLDPFVGRNLRAFIREALAIDDPDTALDIAGQIEAHALRDDGAHLQPIPGAARLVRDLHRAGYRIAICSSASPRAIATSLARLSLDTQIERAISAATLPRGKPDPLPYIETLSRLSLKPDQVIAVEDATPGVRSALAAGLRTIVVGGAQTPQGTLHAPRIADLRLTDQRPE